MIGLKTKLKIAPHITVLGMYSTYIYFVFLTRMMDVLFIFPPSCLCTSGCGRGENIAFSECPPVADLFPIR